MGYMEELRQAVGNRPLIMVGAALIIVNPNRQILMIKRNDNRCWGIPGGALELGETLSDALRRETREEIGIDLKDFELFGVYSGLELFYQYPDGAEVYNVSIVYITRNMFDDIHVNLDEHSEYQYFDLESLPAEISPPIKPVLRDLVSMERVNPNRW